MSEAGKQRANLELGLDEALVLFELLANCDEQSSIEVPGAGKKLALLRIHGELERSSVEPFRPHHQELLLAAGETLGAEVRSQA